MIELTNQELMQIQGGGIREFYFSMGYIAGRQFDFAVGFINGFIND